MAGVAPTGAFSSVDLDIATMGAGEYGRIHSKDYPDPLGFGKNATRFSDPRRRIEKKRFGLLYLGSSLKVCFVEAVLRDRRDGAVGDFPIAETELDDRFYSRITVSDTLKLVDLTGDGPVRMGIPSDVVRGRTQTLARKWSLAIYNHPAGVDGIVYPSRLNNETNLAIYDRAVPKLAAIDTDTLSHAPGIGKVLDDFRVALL